MLRRACDFVRRPRLHSTWHDACREAGAGVPPVTNHRRFGMKHALFGVNGAPPRRKHRLIFKDGPSNYLNLYKTLQELYNFLEFAS